MIVATQFEYIMYCTDCHEYLVPGDDHCVDKLNLVKQGQSDKPEVVRD